MALATFVYGDTVDTLSLERRHALPLSMAAPVTLTGYQTMVDSAWPISNPPAADITLIYIGGDTPHPWTTAEVKAAFGRTKLLWPCWVRSNPSAVNATSDANAAVATLHAYGVPSGVNCILDLETAVNTSYVNTFNDILAKAGYDTCKYGSSGSIWNNPKTSGGTFVASPGRTSPITIGDCVATQYQFAGSFDRSWVKDGAVSLWGADMAITDADVAKILKGIVDTTSGATLAGVLRRTDPALPAIQNTLVSVQATLAKVLSATGQSVDPGAIASAVVADLAAQGQTAEQIAQHVLAGLPDSMANEVVTVMSTRLAS